LDLSLEIFNAVCQTSNIICNEMEVSISLRNGEDQNSNIKFTRTTHQLSLIKKWIRWNDHAIAIGCLKIDMREQRTKAILIKDRTIIESLLLVHDFHFNSFLENPVYKMKTYMLTIPVPPKSHKSTIQRTSSSLILHTDRIIKKRNWLQNYDIGV